MPLRVPDEELVIPRVPWSVIESRLRRMWVIRDAPHHSIIGQTRSGKSYLARHGILNTCQFEKVLIIDCKGDDPTTQGLGKVVHRFPSKLNRVTREMMTDRRNAQVNWYRLVTDMNPSVAKDQVHEALTRVMQQGDWIVVVDELRYITDAKEPNVGLQAYWEQMILRGGSRGVGVVSLSQEPRFLPGSFYTQGSFYWFSRIEDERALQRVSEVGSSRQLLDHLKRVPRREWIYMDSLEDERFWALTKVGR